MTVYESRKLFRCYEVKIEESEKAIVTGSRMQDTFGLSSQKSATEPQQLLTEQSHTIISIYTALNASFAYLAATQYMCSQKSVRGRMENSH